MPSRAVLESGRLVSATLAEGRRLVARYERTVAECSIGADGVVRLRAALGNALAADASEAIGRDPWKPAPAEILRHGDGSPVDGDDGIRLRSGPVDLLLGARSFSLVVFFEGRRLVEMPGATFATGAASCRFSLSCSKRSRFFGFGEKAGSLDKRGQVLAMRTRDADLRHGDDPLYVSIPFFLAVAPSFGVVHSHAPARTESHGVLVDCFATSRFDVARSDAESVAVDLDAEALDLFVFPGPAPADVVRRFTALVGRGPLPPRWALGHHQSRWSYASERAVRSIAAKLRERSIPTDAIHLDIDYMDGFRVFTWNRRRFPDPATLVRDLRENGFRTVAIVDPGVKVDEEYATYRRGLARGAFCRRRDGSLYTLRVWPGETVLPDFQRADVRQWWAEEHDALLEPGIDGIWNDMNEPAGWAADLRFGKLLLPYRKQDTRELEQADPVAEGRSLPHEKVRNLYALQECRATRAALEAARPELRPFVLTRSGYAGIQRFAAVWTGDNASRWRDLGRSIPMLLNLSLSGVALCGADIGGFSMSCSAELYARWIQLGALYPFARTHSMWLGRRQDPTAFGARTEAVARAALSLRMRLLPYLYGLLREAELTGTPPWRPLFFEFPDDAASYDIEDQVMLGPSLLVAPVVEKGSERRSVYLPPGNWAAFEEGSLYEGGCRVDVAAPLEKLPLFVRTPAVLATQSVVQHTGERPAEPLVLDVYAPLERGAYEGRGASACTADVYEDDGETTAYRQGAWALTRVRCETAPATVRLDVEARRGAFAVAARPVRAVLRRAAEAAAVLCDGREIPLGSSPESGALWARPSGRDLELGFLCDGKALRLVVEWE